MAEKREGGFEIQVSSTTLGYEGDGGKVPSIIALGKSVVSEEKYTDIVVRNAEKFKKETVKEIPVAKFGVSVLASAVYPMDIANLIRSVDYPYRIRWGTDFIKEKYARVKKEGYGGLGAGIAVGQELAYALLQARTDTQQMDSTVKAGEQVRIDPVRIRTCIKTVSIDDELKKIKEITGRLKDESKNVTWVIEPNKGLGDGTIVDFINRFDQIRRFNPSLNFGIDFDFGGLPAEENQHILNVLERLDNSTLFPLLISLSGTDYTQGDVRSHLPLGDNAEYNELIGDWYRDRISKGRRIPGIVIETSPTQQNVLKDYQKFLQSFKKGFNK